MSVLIKGMKMPRGCYECPLLDGEYGGCKAGATGLYDPYCEDCPLEEPKTGKWIFNPDGIDWNIPAWECSECRFKATHIGVVPNGLGDSPMIWVGSKFCPQCGTRIIGYER